MDDEANTMTPAPRNVRADVDGILHELARMTGLGERRELHGLQPVLDRTRNLLRRALDVVETEGLRRGVALHLSQRHPFEVVELVESAQAADHKALAAERTSLLDVLRRVTGDDLRELDYVTFDATLRKVTQVVEFLDAQVRGMREGGAGELTFTAEDVAELHEIASRCPELMPQGLPITKAAVAGVKNGEAATDYARRANVRSAEDRARLDAAKSDLAAAMGAEPGDDTLPRACGRLREWGEACAVILRKLGPWVGATTHKAQPSTLTDLGVLLGNVLRDQAAAVRVHVVQSSLACGILSAALARAGVDVPDGLGLAQLAALVETRLGQAQQARPDPDSSAGGA